MIENIIDKFFKIVAVISAIIMLFLVYAIITRIIMETENSVECVSLPSTSQTPVIIGKMVYLLPLPSTRMKCE